MSGLPTRYFIDLTQPEIAAQLKKTPPDPSSIHAENDIPIEVDELILRCLGKRPDDRFDDILSLGKACTEILRRRDAKRAAERLGCSFSSSTS